MLIIARNVINKVYFLPKSRFLIRTVRGQGPEYHLTQGLCRRGQYVGTDLGGRRSQVHSGRRYIGNALDLNLSGNYHGKLQTLPHPPESCVTLPFALILPAVVKPLGINSVCILEMKEFLITDHWQD